VVSPLLAVTRFQGTFDQSDEPIVLDVFSKDVCQDGVVDVVETPFDISFDEPLGPWPELVYFFEGRVASPARSESVGVVGELWFVLNFCKLG
jgi:hypothetical protein